MVLSTKHMLDHLMHHIAIVAQEYLLTTFHSSRSVQEFIKPIFYVSPNLFSGALFGWFVNCGVGFGCFARGPIYLRSVKMIQAPWTYVHIVFLVVFVFTEPSKAPPRGKERRHGIFYYHRFLQCLNGSIVVYQVTTLDIRNRVTR